MAGALDPRPKAIIFDCWNTLFHSNVGSSLQTFSQRFLHKKLTYGLVKKFEEAYMVAPHNDMEAATTTFLKSVHIPATPQVRAWTQARLASSLSRQQPYGDTFGALTELRQRGYKLGMITNSWKGAFEYLCSHQPVREHFDVTTTSYECGLIKPDPQIFQLTVERLGIRPEEALMVGDNHRDDVEAAHTAGLQSVLLDRSNNYLERTDRLTSLAELLERL